MSERKRLAVSFVAALVVLTIGGLAHAQPLKNVAAAAKDVAEGVGTVGHVSTGTSGTVFVFEEYHTSRIGQLQIAVMMLRLRDRYGVKKIGLEGAIQDTRPLDGNWFRGSGGPLAAEAREDVAVRMVAEGEMSSAEFMAILFPDVQVFGTELKKEYDVGLDVKGSPELSYLLAIGSKLLTQEQIRRANDLIKANKQQDAIEYILTQDTWVRQQYEARKDQRATSLEEMMRRAQEVQKKADSLGVTVEAEVRADMAKLLKFYETAASRSDTMVKYVLAQLGVAGGGVASMVIGAAHTDRVVKLLRDQKVSVARIAPIALNPKAGNLTMEQFERKNQGKFGRIAPGTLGGILNRERKPPPIIGSTTGQSYASALLATALVARAARDGKKIPDDVWSQIGSLPELRIDRSSFTQDGYDVMFQMWAKGTDGRESEVWVRVGTAETKQDAKTLEEKLLQAVADMGGGGRIPPRKPPSNSAAVEGEGAADGKRGEVLINRIGTREVAAFGKSKGAVTAVGKISG